MTSSLLEKLPLHQNASLYRKRVPLCWWPKALTAFSGGFEAWLLVPVLPPSTLGSRRAPLMRTFPFGDSSDAESPQTPESRFRMQSRYRAMRGCPRAVPKGARLKRQREQMPALPGIAFKASKKALASGENYRCSSFDFGFLRLSLNPRGFCGGRLEEVPSLLASGRVMKCRFKGLCSAAWKMSLLCTR